MPDVRPSRLPAVLRGAAESDLPEPAALRLLTHPTLVLAWPGDDAHPLSTARRLVGLLPNARLRVADSLKDVRGWAACAAAFIADPAAPLPVRHEEDHG